MDGARSSTVIMIKLLVVDVRTERRAGIVHAVCELPGIEVRASTADVSSALGIIDTMRIDAVVVTNDLPSSSIVTLIDCARRRGLSDIIVAVTQHPLLPGMGDYWRDLGARYLVDTMPELVARVSELAVERDRDEERRHTNAVQLDVAEALARPRLMRTYAASPVGALAEATAASVRTVHAVPPETTLQPVVSRLADVVPPEVELHFQVGLDIPRVRCAAADVQQIAVLLVRDACEVLPLGGKVWLIVEREGPRHVRLEVLESSGRLRVPGRDLDTVRTIAARYGGEARVVDLGSASSVQVVLPAAVDPPN